MLLEATGSEFSGIADLAAKGGTVALLAGIVYLLIRRAPVIADRIADSHTKAIDACTAAHVKAIDTCVAGQSKQLEAFQSEARETRSLFRQEQDAARQQSAALLREERATCDARMARLEQKLDANRERFGDLSECLTKLAATIESKERS